jgi:hypothetical protein
MLDLLGDLPRKMTLLPLMLMPGQSPAGEKVATTRVGSPTSARLDALSLVGPGSVPVPGALHPLVRRTCTTRTVEVEVRVGAYKVETHTTTLPEWHQEVVIDRATGEPVLVTDDDQLGVLPPSEWLAQQCATWRTAFGHRKKPAAYVTATPKRMRDPIGWILAHGTAEQVAAMFAVNELKQQFRQGVTNLMLGYEPGYRGRRPARLREDDPVSDAWELRFGQPGLSRDDALHVRYLRTWLEQATDHDALDVAGFAAGLRSLSAELTRVLGEKPDQQWLGRCPATITDRDAGTKTPCGAGLWQDPHASVVECPRCHGAWGPRTVHLMHLASEIRRVWPLDRRRRYNADEIDALWPAGADGVRRPIGCPTCQFPIVIDWQDVTATGDTRRWWRPVRTRCTRNGCDSAREIM